VTPAASLLVLARARPACCPAEGAGPYCHSEEGAARRRIPAHLKPTLYVIATAARPGEGNRPWSAGAGPGALVTGLVQVAWVLQETRKQLVQPVAAFLAWDLFVRAQSGLFLWEAFVSAGGKRGDHLSDAQVAVKAFVAALPDPRSVNAVRCISPVYSLVGSALLRTGWASNLAVLGEPCLVVKC
jgi:hypothetical protein